MSSTMHTNKIWSESEFVKVKTFRDFTHATKIQIKENYDT
jgi:hypothetical protein